MVLPSLHSVSQTTDREQISAGFAKDWHPRLPTYDQYVFETYVSRCFCVVKSAGYDNMAIASKKFGASRQNIFEMIVILFKTGAPGDFEF